MRNDSDRLQWQTEKNYIMNTFHNGLRRIQTDSKTAQQYVLLCLALAVAALIMVSGGSGEDVISVVYHHHRRGPPQCCTDLPQNF